VAHLFRDSTEVDLDPLHGGFSEATVWRAVSRDALGQQHAPAVVKLGPNRSIAQERVALELRLRSPAVQAAADWN
jgi:hypothetical protein